MTATSGDHIKLACTSCNAAMEAPSSAAGRTVRCPKCQHKLRVPDADRAAAQPSRPAASATPPLVDGDRLKISCENCGKQLRVPANAAGKRVKCPGCRSAFVVAAPPSSSPDSAAVDDGPYLGTDDDLLSGLAGGEAVEPPPDAMAAQAAAATPKCPKCGAGMFFGATVCPSCGHDKAPKTKSRSGPKLRFALPAFNFNIAALFEKRIARLWFGVVFLGGLAIFMGVREARLNKVAQLEPQKISCAQLATDGPRDNVHVVMSDFLLCDYIVYETRGSSWNKAWVPAVPLGSEYHRQILELLDDRGELTGPVPQPTDFKVIVELPGASGPEYIDRIAEQETIHGTIVNVIQKLDQDTKRLLRNGYGVDPDDCWILVEGRTPGGSSRVWNYVGGGIVLIAFGGIMLLRLAS